MPGVHIVSIDFDVDPKLVRFVIIAVLLLCGVHFDELTVLVGL